MGYIYEITNDVNGKMYVGKTERANPKSRWYEHLRDYKLEKYKHRPLYRAMNKYGREHFHFKIIEKTNNKEETYEREQYWINKLNTYIHFDNSNGYNATLGGDGKCYLDLDENEVINYHKNEDKYVIERTAIHFNVSKTTIKNILLKNNIAWIKNKDLNALKSYEEYGGVIQVSPKHKIVENIFISLKEASDYIGINSSYKKLSNTCNGINNDSHYAYGYLWYYGKDIHKIKDELKFIY